jgi:hypothetical protein
MYQYGNVSFLFQKCTHTEWPFLATKELKPFFILKFCIINVMDTDIRLLYLYKKNKLSGLISVASLVIFLSLTVLVLHGHNHLRPGRLFTLGDNSFGQCGRKIIGRDYFPPPLIYLLK